jgi:serine/threonine protein kinase
MIAEELGSNLERGRLQRFLREAQVVAALRSPHVVQVLDYCVDGDTPHIVMERLEGESLADRLTRVGLLNLRGAARVVQQVSRALACARSGHRAS